MKLLLMADSSVGQEVVHWLIAEYPKDLVLIVTISENDIYRLAQDAGVPNLIFESSDQVSQYIYEEGIEPDLGVLAWWPALITQPLIGLPKCGFINTHPSLLPYNRGKHYNFWALVEQNPFGVSLHMIDEGIDSGDVVSQKEIPYSWEDNGETLYNNAQSAIIDLFKETYPLLRDLGIPRHKQNLALGSFHKSSEIDVASEINLEKQYRARDILNLLRARTFAEKPACWFREDNEEYEVRIEIVRKRL